MAEDINKGDTVRVLVEGTFQGQEVKVLLVHQSPHSRKRSYLLDTTWNGIPRSSWFERDEIERVTPEESRGVV